MTPHSATPSTIMLDEPLLGLEVFLRDLGWNTLKVKQGRSDDEVLGIASEGNYILVTKDTELAERCRLRGVRVVELGVREEARLVDQILRRDFAILSK